MGRLNVGIGNVIEDTSPQLGGNLDANGSVITGLGHLGFLASQVASAGANDLDDYEEGTWTPELRFGGGTTGITYDLQGGDYVKTGRKVYLQYRIILTNKGSSNGVAQIHGLPFVGAGNQTGCASLPQVITFANQFFMRDALSASRLDIVEVTEAGVFTVLDDANFANTSAIEGSVSYSV